MRRSKILVLEDVWFSYSLMAVLSSIYKGNVMITDYAHYIVLSFAMSTFLVYVEPMDNLIYLFLRFYDKRMLDKPNSAYLLRNAFESSYLDYSRIRLKSAIYLVILLVTIAILWEFSMIIKS